MANATKAREASRKPGEMVAYPVAGGAIGQVYKGTLVFTQHGNTPTSEGYAGNTARSVAGNADVLLGVAYKNCFNQSGVDGAKVLEVVKRGTFRFTIAAAAQVNIGQKVYALDNQTVTLTSTNNVYVGEIVEIIDAVTVAVRIDHATL